MASKKWDKTLCYIELDYYDKIHLKKKFDARKVEFINESIYKFLLNLFDNNKIKKLKLGVG